MNRFLSLVAGVLDPPEPADAAGPEEERLATAALLIHVARANGRFPPERRAELTERLRERFDLGEGAADRLVAAADRLDRGTDDLAEIVDRLGHSLDPAGRRDLVRLAFEVAEVEGEVGEVADALVWRLAHLLGLSDTDLSRTRAAAIRPPSGA